MAHEEDRNIGPGPPGRVQHDAHVGHDPLPAALLGDEAEAARGGGGPVAAVVAGQDRIALLHRRGGEAGVARGVLGHAVGDDDDAPGAGSAGYLHARRGRGGRWGVGLGGVGHQEGAVDEPLGEPDVHDQTRSVVGCEPSKAGLHRVLLKQRRQSTSTGRRSGSGRHRSSLIVSTTGGRRRRRVRGLGPRSPVTPGWILVVRRRAGSVTVEVILRCPRTGTLQSCRRRPLMTDCTGASPTFLMVS